MCSVCGCGGGEATLEDGKARNHGHDHGHDHHHEHDHGHNECHGHEHPCAPDHEHVHEHVGPDGTVIRHSHDHHHNDAPVGGGHGHDHDRDHGDQHVAGHHHHDDHHPHHHHHDPEGGHYHGPDGGHHHDPEGGHNHAPEAAATRILRVEQDILAKNNAYAAANRELFQASGSFAVNLMSSPGAGKTTLLVRTLTDLKGRFPAAVIEGDQQTSLDADRIRATGAPALQVNTGKGCHLDALMVTRAIGRLGLPAESVLFIENVGNLVCPAGFDLGETKRVVVLSTTEGEDKPLKYPDMFAGADLLLVNKIDLLPHVSFDVGRMVEYARRIRPGLEVIELSATSGQGLKLWYDWIGAGLAAAHHGRGAHGH